MGILMSGPHHFASFLNPLHSVFDISFNIYVIASVLGMNEKFVASLHNFIFKSPSIQQIPVIIIMDTIFNDIKDGWMDGHKDRGGQTDI